MRVPVDTRTIQTERFTFRPNGRTERFGLTMNPAVQIAKVTWSARLFIGFNVGDKPTWTLAKVVALVKKFRTAQGEDPDATFFATRGLYTERKAARSRLINEDGCQVVILNMSDPPKPEAEFRDQMVDLGERLVTRMKQDKIYVEIQRNGLSRGVWEVTP